VNQMASISIVKAGIHRRTCAPLIRLRRTHSRIGERRISGSSLKEFSRRIITRSKPVGRAIKYIGIVVAIIWRWIEFCGDEHDVRGGGVPRTRNCYVARAGFPVRYFDFFCFESLLLAMLGALREFC